MGQPKLSHRFTGLGVISAAGWGLAATSARLFANQASELALTDPSESRFFKLAHETNVFLPNAFALSAANEALRNAGLEAAELARLRVGVCIGSTVGGSNFQERFGQDFFAEKFPNPEALEAYFQTNTAQFLARHWACKGPVQMLSNACTSGADAIGVAAHWLDADLCDLVICGGTEVILPRMFYGFRALMLCTADECKPFDRQRTGLKLGEGAGMVVLEKATSRRASCGEFLGYGCSSDAYHPTSPDPEARGLDRAVRQSCTHFDRIDFINAHGTGTPHNDLAEGTWIARFAPQAKVVATKGYTGHTLGAAGAIEAVLTLLSLQQGLLPKSLGFTELDPEIGIAPTRTLESGDFTTALSLSLGFGGINSALHLGRAT